MVTRVYDFISAFAESPSAGPSAAQLTSAAAGVAIRIARTVIQARVARPIGITNSANSNVYLAAQRNYEITGAGIIDKAIYFEAASCKTAPRIIGLTARQIIAG